MADILIPMFLFFLNDTATTEIYTLSLHDALPISAGLVLVAARENSGEESLPGALPGVIAVGRSEEHTSELQSRGHLVCRLLLEKKNDIIDRHVVEKQTIRQLPEHDAPYDHQYRGP